MPPTPQQPAASSQQPAASYFVEKSSLSGSLLGARLDALAGAVALGPEAAAACVSAPLGLPVEGLNLSAGEGLLLFWAFAAVYREEVAAAFGRWSGGQGPCGLTRAVLCRLAAQPLEACEAQWASALHRRGRLMRLGLLALEGDALVPSAALRLRVAGLDLWPDDLHDVVWLSEGQALRPVLPDATAQHLDKLCRQWGEHGPAPLTYLIGPAGTGRTMCARQLAAARASRVLCVDTSRWPDDRDILTLAREARWRGAALLLRFASDTLGVRWRGYVRALLAEDVDVLISLPAGGPPESFDARAVAWLTLGPSQQAERRLLWARHLPQARRVPSLTDEALAFRFRGSPASIARLARQALDRAETDQARVGFVHISEAAQAMMSGKLSQLATLERPLAQGLGAVVLPAQAMAQLRELLGRVSHREQVLERWGFGDRLRSGLGTVAMFSGPPGTGKTLSARAVAGELGVSLYRIDLSQVFSKWIGETEKHLGALFDEAEASGAALLFDEADALFAKRTEVRSSNDRYANLESAFLLQRIEAFTGLCFLTTNMDRSIDDAFMRRMAVHLRFAMPAQAEREAIWRGSLPEVAPLASDVSLSALAARFEISGGAIRNAALRAAYRAAQAEAEITQADLIASAEQESASSGALTRSSGR